MPDYRRSLVAGGTFFFTVVTFKRRPILTTTHSRRILRDAWKSTVQRFPFETFAICLLPDHLHTIWKLPDGDADYSTRWREIKRLFSMDFEGRSDVKNLSRDKRREATVWQRRFWEHTIRDELDLLCHVEYIHYNPVKHGYVAQSSDWQWSSFRRYVNRGLYPIEWGEISNFSKTHLRFGE